MILVHFQANHSTVIQGFAPTTDANEAEVDWFYEGLQDLLELTPKIKIKIKDVLFIVGGWNAKVESQEIPVVSLTLEYKMKKSKG